MTGREQKQAKAGYHHEGGILPFVLISAYMWSESVYSAGQKLPVQEYLWEIAKLLHIL